MEKHPEAVKLYKSIERFSNAQAAESIAFGVDLPLDPSKEQRAKWVSYISSKLEETFDDSMIKQIRQGCYCRDNGILDENKKWLKELYSSSESIEQFVEKVNSYDAGWYIQEGYLFTKYFDCSCPLLEGIELLKTKTWCHCTSGFGKEVFDDVFGFAVDAEIIDSIKMGNEYCLIKISREDGSRIV